MKAIALILCALLVAGCGGVAGGCEGDAAPNGVDARLTGAWSASAEVPLPREPIMEYHTTVRVGAYDAGLIAIGLCPNGLGTLHAEGSGASIEWTGDVYCPLESPLCPDGSVHLYHGAVEVLNGALLSLALDGWRLGCGAPQPVILRLIGSKAPIATHVTEGL